MSLYRVLRKALLCPDWNDRPGEFGQWILCYLEAGETKALVLMVPNPTLFPFFRLSQRTGCGSTSLCTYIHVLDDSCYVPQSQTHTFLVSENVTGPLAHKHLWSQAELTGFTLCNTVAIQTPPQRNLHHPKPIHYALPCSLPSSVCVHACARAHLVSTTTAASLRQS